MQDNPYQAIVELMRETARGQMPTGVCTGTVVSSEPVGILAGGLTLTAEDLLFSAGLKPGTAYVQGTALSGALTIDGESRGVSGGTLAGTAQIQPAGLAAGDRVALLYIGASEDKFIVLCKVVDA